MNTSYLKRGALLALAVVLGPVRGLAANPADVAAQRRQILDEMLTSDPPYAVAAQRWVCAMGQEPDSVAEHRAKGASFFPDAADSCVTALARSAHDHNLPALYGKLITELGGSSDASERLPHAIGAAVLNNATNVAIGNGKAAVVTPALAFDAGFTVSYQDGAAKKAVNPERLKTLAEACLNQQQDAGTCFSAGYVYGARAFSGETLSTR